MSGELQGAEPLVLLGAGKMGGAMLDGWLERGLDPRQVRVIDPHLDAARASELRSRGVLVASSDGDPAGSLPAKVLVLAVKPQTMAEALPAAAPLAGRQTIVISVAAGIRLSTLEAGFAPGQPVVRAMPNTPAQIGQGMTVAVPNAHVARGQRDLVDRLLAAVGAVAWADDEALIDAVTAVSGSGPAYVFLLAECLAEAGRQAGLPADLAAQLARQTVAGSGALLGGSALPPDELRRAVTSPNGTTAAALAVLMAEDGLQPLLTRAVAAARKRSIELG
jgi:pyrroline-5-carboxylate reductase